MIELQFFEFKYLNLKMKLKMENDWRCSNSFNSQSLDLIYITMTTRAGNRAG